MEVGQLCYFRFVSTDIASNEQKEAGTKGLLVKVVGEIAFSNPGAGVMAYLHARMHACAVHACD